MMHLFPSYRCWYCHLYHWHLHGDGNFLFRKCLIKNSNKTFLLLVLQHYHRMGGLLLFCILHLWVALGKVRQFVEHKFMLNSWCSLESNQPHKPSTGIFWVSKRAKYILILMDRNWIANSLSRFLVDEMC